MLANRLVVLLADMVFFGMESRRVWGLSLAAQVVAVSMELIPHQMAVVHRPSVLAAIGLMSVVLKLLINLERG